MARKIIIITTFRFQCQIQRNILVQHLTPSTKSFHVTLFVCFFLNLQKILLNNTDRSPIQTLNKDSNQSGNLLYRNKHRNIMDSGQKTNKQNINPPFFLGVGGAWMTTLYHGGPGFKHFIKTGRFNTQGKPWSTQQFVMTENGIISTHSRTYARATGARAQGGKFPGAAY